MSQWAEKISHVRKDLSNLSVPANNKSFGAGHDKNLSERPSYLSHVMGVLLDI